MTTLQEFIWNKRESIVKGWSDEPYDRYLQWVADDAGADLINFMDDLLVDVGKEGSEGEGSMAQHSILFVQQLTEYLDEIEKLKRKADRHDALRDALNDFLLPD